MMRWIAALVVVTGCSGSLEEPEERVPVQVVEDTAALEDTNLADTAVTNETASEPDSAADTALDAPVADALPYPAGTKCEYGFFKKYFDRDNGEDHGALRDASFARIAEQTKTLQACGAKVTLGGMLSLMIYEGGGAKVAFFNDRCAENSYDKSATCWNTPKARYSYQYGIAPVHMSNFHPCADVGYTSKMRARLHKAMTDAAFAATPAEIASVDAQLKTFCPSSTATLVDYYILTAHSRFAVPPNGSGNDLKNAGVYPFFTPRVVIDIFFATLSGACVSLTTDEAAIGVFGGGDASYRTAAKQATILELWRAYRTSSC